MISTLAISIGSAITIITVASVFQRAETILMDASSVSPRFSGRIWPGSYSLLPRLVREQQDQRHPGEGDGGDRDADALQAGDVAGRRQGAEEDGPEDRDPDRRGELLQGVQHSGGGADLVVADG